MYYTQVLRVKRAFVWFACISVGLWLLIVAVAAANGAYEMPLHPSRDEGIPLPALFALAGFIAAIFIAIFGRSLSEENEMHQPVVWTKPFSRARIAMAYAGISALGMLAAFALTLVLVVAFIATFRAVGFIDVTPDSGIQLLRFLAFPLSYYAILVAATASLGKAGRGVFGWVLVASILFPILESADFGRPWNQIFAAVNVINPLTYFGDLQSKGSSTGWHAVQAVAPAVSVDLAALSLLCSVGLALGVWQWRRLES